MSQTTVTFDSAGIRIAGDLYAPDRPATKRLPAIVVGHPGSGVKEQASGLYARLLAEHGYITLAYDAAFQGESGGTPRGLENPAQRIEDFKGAVSYLQTRDDVDSDRIGVLGICASGGYSLVATASDHRIKALATVSLADIARQFRLGADGAQDPAVFQGLLDAAATARTAHARGESDSVPTFSLFPDTVEQAEAAGREHGVEGFEYYCTPRGFHDRSMRQITWNSVDLLATFDAFASVPLIGQRPLLMVVGREAVTAWMSVEAFQKHVGLKEIMWVAGATHVDLYDKLEFVAPVIQRIAEFFRTSLP